MSAYAAPVNRLTGRLSPRLSLRVRPELADLNLPRRRNSGTTNSVNSLGRSEQSSESYGIHRPQIERDTQSCSPERLKHHRHETLNTKELKKKWKTIQVETAISVTFPLSLNSLTKGRVKLTTAAEYTTERATVIDSMSFAALNNRNPEQLETP